MLRANDDCWCGSGKKYKRCHKAALVHAGTVGPERAVPDDIVRPDYATPGAPVRTTESAVKSPDVIERMRVAVPHRARRAARDGRGRRSGDHHRRARPRRARGARGARRLPEPAPLQGLSQVGVHVGQRGHLPRHPRRPRTRRGRHRQPRHHRLRRRCARRHQRDVLRRDGRRRIAPPREGHRGVPRARHRRGATRAHRSPTSAWRSRPMRTPPASSWCAPSWATASARCSTARRRCRTTTSAR